MTDYLGVRRFCEKCAFAKKKWKSVYCDNPDSGFFRRKVNSVLLAPCFTPTEPQERRKEDAAGQSG